MKWLFVTHRWEFNIAKMAHELSDYPDRPNYLTYHRRTLILNLQSLTAPKLEVPIEVGTIEDCGARSFDNLLD